MRRMLLLPILVAACFISGRTQTAQLDSPQTSSSTAPELLQARQLLLEASTLTKNAPERQQEVMVANISGQLMRAGDLPAAQATISLLKNPEGQAEATGSIAWSLTNSGHTETALRLIAATKAGNSRDVAYRQVAQLLADKKDFDEAMQVAQSIESPYYHSDALVRIASSQTHHADRSRVSKALQEALEVAETATKRDPACAVIFNDIALVEREIGPTPEAISALRTFTTIAFARKDETGETDYLQQLAETRAQLGDTTGALQLVRTLPKGSSADSIYMAISDEALRHSSVTEALAAASKIAEPSMREFALQHIAEARSSDASLTDAKRAVEKIETAQAKGRAIAHLALEQSRFHDPVAYQTIQLWRETIGDGVGLPSTGQDKIVVAYALLAEFANARQMLDNLRDPEDRAWALWNLTGFLVQKGRLQEALDLANNESSDHAKVYALLGTATGILDRAESDAQAMVEKKQ
jgi:lipopolysaccharide biosynthesis regulator YciM